MVPLGKTGGGCQPLHAACSSGQLDAVRQLLAAGTALDQRDREHGWTPLHAACDAARCMASTGVIEALLQAGASTAARDNQQLTPLMVLVAAGSRADENAQCKVAQLLLEAGADLEAHDAMGRTAFDMALAAEWFDVSALLQQADLMQHLEQLSTVSPWMQRMAAEAGRAMDSRAALLATQQAQVQRQQQLEAEQREQLAAERVALAAQRCQLAAERAEIEEARRQLVHMLARGGTQVGAPSPMAAGEAPPCLPAIPCCRVHCAAGPCDL